MHRWTLENLYIKLFLLLLHMANELVCFRKNIIHYFYKVRYLTLTLMPQQYKLSVPIYIFGIQIHKSYVAKGSHIAQRC